MSVPLRCPNCYDNLGKDKENAMDATCSNCGASFFNDGGYIVDEAHYKKIKEKYPKRKLPKLEKL